MKELVFNIENIFNSKTPEGCFSQYGATLFHIPAYQRGYKWATGSSGAVTVLLKDLWNAFKKEEEEYYLQYITVKLVRLGSNACLEVIDGQQRLTTLSILLSVLNWKLKKADKDSIAYEKLDYAIRGKDDAINFFEELVYKKDKLEEIAQLDWGKFIAKDKKRLDHQDIFYLHGAAKKCTEFFESEECTRFFESEAKSIDDFEAYLFKSVKLIVNSVEQHVQSEEIFKNLNSNRVPLSEVELIKALFITRVGRDRVLNSESNFREVMEVRLSLSRTWDDIQQWAQSSKIASFYFDNDETSPLHELLKLTALVMGAEKSVLDDSQLSDDRPLFHFFSQQQSTKKSFEELVNTQAYLKDWFDTDKMYHLIGFCCFAKGGSGNKTLDFLKECLEQTKVDKSTKGGVKSFLVEKSSKLLFGAENKEGSIKDLKYGENNDQIHAVLLALSVFPGKGTSRRFDFDSFKRQNWSLEHIFPQTPEGKGHILTEDEKENIKVILKEANETNEVRDKIERLLEKESRLPGEQQVYIDAIRKTGTLDDVGNMCLLTGFANIVLSCSPFYVKRQKILELIQKGSFVPKHTFDVFAKMINVSNSDLKLDDNLKQWSKNDIDAHAQYIVNSILEIER